MRKSNPNVTSTRNHLSPLVRARKGALGVALMFGAFLAIFGPRSEVSVMLQAMILAGGFVCFGLGWAGISQALMGWSKQYDFDFEKCEIRQVSGTIFGRSRPYVVPFIRIEGLEVKPGNITGEGALEGEGMIEVMAPDGRAFVRAGMFETMEDAEEMAEKLRNAIVAAKKAVGIE